MPSAIEFYGFVVITFVALMLLASKCSQLQGQIDRMRRDWKLDY